MKEIRTNIYTSMFLTLVGAVILLFPTYEINNTKWIFFGVMCAYALVGFIRLILIKGTKSFVLGICSIIIGLLLLILELTKEPLTLSFSLLAWITISSFVKLFKTDEFHDRHDRRWVVSLINFGLFIIIGILSCINLYYSSNIQVLVLGFFFFIAGSLDLISHAISFSLENKAIK